MGMMGMGSEPTRRAKADAPPAREQPEGVAGLGAPCPCRAAAPQLALPGAPGGFTGGVTGSISSKTTGQEPAWPPRLPPVAPTGPRQPLWVWMFFGGGPHNGTALPPPAPTALELPVPGAWGPRHCQATAGSGPTRPFLFFSPSRPQVGHSPRPAGDGDGAGGHLRGHSLETWQILYGQRDPPISPGKIAPREGLVPAPSGAMHCAGATHPARVPVAWGGGPQPPSPLQWLPLVTLRDPGVTRVCRVSASLAERCRLAGPEAVWYRGGKHRAPSPREPPRSTRLPRVRATRGSWTTAGLRGGCPTGPHPKTAGANPALQNLSPSPPWGATAPETPVPPRGGHPAVPSAARRARGATSPGSEWASGLYPSGGAPRSRGCSSSSLPPDRASLRPPPIGPSPGEGVGDGCPLLKSHGRALGPPQPRLAVPVAPHALRAGAQARGGQCQGAQRSPDRPHGGETLPPAPPPPAPGGARK